MILQANLDSDEWTQTRFGAVRRHDKTPKLPPVGPPSANNAPDAAVEVGDASAAQPMPPPMPPRARPSKRKPYDKKAPIVSAIAPSAASTAGSSAPRHAAIASTAARVSCTPPSISAPIAARSRPLRGSVRELCAAGAWVDHPREGSGFTPLMFCAQNSHLDSALALIRARAKLDTLNTKDSTSALHIASRNGHVDVVRALLEAGAGVDIPKGATKTTALMMACAAGAAEAAAEAASGHCEDYGAVLRYLNKIS